jgi:hypothetical protein
VSAARSARMKAMTKRMLWTVTRWMVIT